VSTGVPLNDLSQLVAQAGRNTPGLPMIHA
jgi:hypothetical protein